MYMYFTGWPPKKKDYQQQKSVTAPILKPAYDRKLETFFLASHVCFYNILILIKYM